MSFRLSKSLKKSMRLSSFSSEDGKEIDLTNDTNEDEDEDDLLDSTSPISSICKACLFYIEEEKEASPDTLYSIIKRRTVRALQKIVGYKSITKLLNESPFPMNILNNFYCIIIFI